MKQFGVFGLDTGNECLLRGDIPIALPPKPFAVLRYLVEHPGRLITHDELLEALWPETYVQPQVLRTYMLDLRKALGDDAGQPQFIQTVPKRGYRFVAQVSESEPPTAERRKPAAANPVAYQSVAAKVVHEIGSVIVNRHTEIASLRSHLEAARGGRRQIVFVTGESGIGKTALVDAFCDEVEAERACVTRGQCVQGISGKEQYYPVTEALRQLCAGEDGEAACQILARMAPDWLAAMGREGDGAAQPAFRERMPGDLCAALEELAAERLLILMLEDLQWADDSTLHLISALARRRARSKLVVLATFRPRDLLAEHPLNVLKHDLCLRRLCAELALKPFGKTAVRELLVRELGQQELPAGLAAFIHRRSEGNPLFAIAILEHLTAQGYLSRVGDGGQSRWVQTAAVEEMEEAVPDGLAQMIELEVARLGEHEQRIVEAGSLMQIAFPSWAVAAALERDPAEIEEACQDLARRLYFIERAGQDELPDGTHSTFYVFAHGLYREVLWRRQTEARRARRHIRIAERLAELFPGREGAVAREMAVHFVAAGHWQGAMAALRSAARFAESRKAHAEAAELLEQALRLTEHLREGERAEAARELSLELEEAREAGSHPSRNKPMELAKA